MEKMTLSEIAEAVGGGLLYTESENSAVSDIYSITTDSRKVSEGCLFIALKGENFDGHDFADRFISDGGAAALVSQDSGVRPAVLVGDTRKALIDLAAYYRTKFNIPVVAVTGSVGKTTTKSMLAHALSVGMEVLATQGNLNNEIGLPLSILSLENRHKAAVFELGMNHFGEMSRLSRTAKPCIAVITNIGTAHIGNLGSRENILKAKLEITDGLSSNGTLILNGDDKLLWSIKGSLPYNTLYYGFKNSDVDFFAYDVVIGRDKSKFSIKVNGRTYRAEVNLTGQHHVSNALAVISTSAELKLDISETVRGIADFKGVPMRQSVIEKSGVKIIEDCYNASADSMIAAFGVLKQISGTGLSIAVLGDMGELGDYDEQLHRYVGTALGEFDFSVLVTVGHKAALIAEEAKKGGKIETASFFSNIDAAEYLKSKVSAGDVVLFKGSRAAKLEEVSSKLIENL